MNMKWLRDRMGWEHPPPAHLDEIPSEELDWENIEVHVGHPVGMIYRGDNIATYNLQVFAPDKKFGPDEEPVREPVHSPTETDARVLADLPAMLELVEEQLEGLLPDGYQVRITEWNK